MTPVVYRKWRGEVTAILPTLPANPGCFVCYAHIGQHGECSAEWYQGTKPATPDEFRDLHSELQARYDGDLGDRIATLGRQYAGEIARDKP